MTQRTSVKPKLKYFTNYFIVGAFFLLFLIIDLTAGIRASTAELLTRIAYSIILAVSLNIVVGFLGELSLGHAGFMCVGAYIGGLCSNYLHEIISSNLLVLVIAMLIGALTAAIMGLLIGIPTLRLKGDYLAISTLAFGEIVRTIFKNQKIFGLGLGLSTTRYGKGEIIPVKKGLYIAAFVMVFVTIFVTQNMMRSKQGRAIKAIRDNEIAARACGVNVTRYKLVAFVISAAFAGIAGVIYANLNSLVENTSFDFNYSIEILVMVVLGGMGNITGSILAAAALTFVNVKLTVMLSGDMAAIKNLVYALILIVLVVYNNAPALKGLRERFNLFNFYLRLKAKLAPRSVGDTEPPATAKWDKIPTKIAMNSILSTDVTPDKTYTPDKPSGKEDK